MCNRASHLALIAVGRVLIPGLAHAVAANRACCSPWLHMGCCLPPCHLLHIISFRLPAAHGSWRYPCAHVQDQSSLPGTKLPPHAGRCQDSEVQRTPAVFTICSARAGCHQERFNEGSCEGTHCFRRLLRPLWWGAGLFRRQLVLCRSSGSGISWPQCCTCVLCCGCRLLRSWQADEPVGHREGCNGSVLDQTQSNVHDS